MVRKKVIRKRSEAAPVEVLKPLPPPPPTLPIGKVRDNLLLIEKQMNKVFVDRKEAIRVMILAHLAREHYLFVGDPGTGKTALINTFVKHLEDVQYFKVLLGAFTPPEKVFGALDVKAFQDGRYEYVTEGMLPTAELAFLDELFKAGDGLLNELLTALNEREFMGDSIPLISVGAATNWPELNTRTDRIEALYDRMLLRVPISDLADKKSLYKMLSSVEEVENYKPKISIAVADLIAATKAICAVEISASIRMRLGELRDELHSTNGKSKSGMTVSARRLGKLQRVMQANAWLNKRDEVSLDDFDVLRWGLWSSQSDIAKIDHALSALDQAAVQEVTKLIDQCRNMARNVNTASQANKIIGRLVDAIEEVKVLYNRPIYTPDSRRLLSNQMKKFEKEYRRIEELITKV